VKKLLIRWFFCGTEEEYSTGKQIHLEEMKVYRKRWYYILGIILLAAPLIHLIRHYPRWDVWLSVGSLSVGLILTRDTVIEHYVVKLLRERRRNGGADAPPPGNTTQL